MMMVRKSKGLGERHQKILDFLSDYQRENHYPPSIREIGNKTGISSTSVVNYYLDQLEKRGMIQRDRKISRGVRLANSNGSLDTFRVPILGPSLLPSKEKVDNLFALEVQGESMIDAMINDGDIVVLRPATEARNGEMVAVWLPSNNEATLKYFFKEKDRYRLQPANPTMKPIYIKKSEPLEIKGKVVMVIRRMGKLLPA